MAKKPEKPFDQYGGTKRPVALPTKWTPTPPDKKGKMSGVRSTTKNSRY